MDNFGFQQMLDEERERQLYEALDECKEKGVCKEKLLTLVFETGARWLPDDKHMDPRA
jgi:hypothetical protein